MGSIDTTKILIKENICDNKNHYILNTIEPILKIEQKIMQNEIDILAQKSDIITTINALMTTSEKNSIYAKLRYHFNCKSSFIEKNVKPFFDIYVKEYCNEDIEHIYRNLKLSRYEYKNFFVNIINREINIMKLKLDDLKEVNFTCDDVKSLKETIHESKRYKKTDISDEIYKYQDIYLNAEEKQHDPKMFEIFEKLRLEVMRRNITALLYYKKTLCLYYNAMNNYVFLLHDIAKECK